MRSGQGRISLIVVLFTYIIGLAIPQTSNAQDSPQDYLNAHNAARAEVGVGPLVWDYKLASYAKKYANQHINDCELVHSGGPYGEDLSWSSAPDIPGVEAVKYWVDEKANYDYKSNSCIGDKMCGHYTQVVWRDTVRVGCAKVRCNGNKGTLIQCNYDPPGNFYGERPY